MTKRQKALGVTEYGYSRGIVRGEFLADPEVFLAKAATIKKGEYKGIEITKEWFGDISESKHEEVKYFFRGLTAIMSKHFNYTDTHGLDLLTVK